MPLNPFQELRGLRRVKPPHAFSGPSAQDESSRAARAATRHLAHGHCAGWRPPASPCGPGGYRGGRGEKARTEWALGHGAGGGAGEEAGGGGASIGPIGNQMGP